MIKLFLERTNISKTIFEFADVRIVAKLHMFAFVDLINHSVVTEHLG